MGQAQEKYKNRSRFSLRKLSEFDILIHNMQMYDRAAYKGQMEKCRQRVF